MGKASRWMINFLLGKKEDKSKKKDAISFHEDSTQTPSTPATPANSSSSYKRRWSFGKSSSKERVVHKTNKFLDSIPTTVPLTPHALPWDVENQRNNDSKALALATTHEAIKWVLKPTTIEANTLNKAVEDAAATRIQAAFRSHLARKALHALRGLVKLQALVRGQQVRKQTAATLRSMHALMAIQVRARFHRIQMVKESQLDVRSQSSRLRCSFQENVLTAENKSVERMESGTTKFYSGELSISKQGFQNQDVSFSARNSSKVSSTASSSNTLIPGRASFTYQQPDYVHPISNQHPFVPNYMSNTESSMAKIRSQSEPKQRPKWSMRPKTKGTASMDGMNSQQDFQRERSPARSKRYAHDNQDSWFIKLYRSTRTKDSDLDSKSTADNSYSNYNKSLVTYEPPLNMY